MLLCLWFAVVVNIKTTPPPPEITLLLLLLLLIDKSSTFVLMSHAAVMKSDVNLFELDLGSSHVGPGFKEK